MLFSNPILILWTQEAIEADKLIIILKSRCPYSILSWDVQSSWHPESTKPECNSINVCNLKERDCCRNWRNITETKRNTIFRIENLAWDKFQNVSTLCEVDFILTCIARCWLLTNYKGSSTIIKNRQEKNFGSLFLDPWTPSREELGHFWYFETRSRCLYKK